MLIEEVAVTAGVRVTSHTVSPVGASTARMWSTADGVGWFTTWSLLT